MLRILLCDLLGWHAPHGNTSKSRCLVWSCRRCGNMVPGGLGIDWRK